MSLGPGDAERLQTLAGDIAHDLNNLLGIIINYATLAGVATAHLSEVSADIEQIRIAARQAAVLADQLSLAADAHS